MDKLEKKVRQIVAKDSFDVTCRQCAFYPGDDSCNSWMCLAPWSDLGMEVDNIDHCYEGVYRYITGKPGPHLRKALDQRASTVWLREKGKSCAENQADKWKGGGAQ